MRWERLFQDLEDQIDHETDAELEDLARDEQRLRMARMTISDRLRELATASQEPVPVQFWLAQSVLECAPIRIGRDWVLATVTSPAVKRGTALIPTSAIRGFNFDSRPTTETHRRVADDTVRSTAAISSDITLAFVLRDLCRRRRQVEVWIENRELRGTLERVGKDHVDICDPPGGGRPIVTGARRASILALAHIDLIVLI